MSWVETTRGGNGLGAKRPGFVTCTTWGNYFPRTFWSPLVQFHYHEFKLWILISWLSLHIHLWLIWKIQEATVRPPRRFYEFRTRMMREIAGKGLKITENPCETHARAMRNPCGFSRFPQLTKIGKIRAGIFTISMGENILHRWSVYTVLFVTLIERKEQ